MKHTKSKFFAEFFSKDCVCVCFGILIITVTIINVGILEYVKNRSSNSKVLYNYTKVQE